MSEDMNNNASVLPTASQEDITGDGGVLKHVLVSGVGNEKPQTGDAVSVHYVGTLMSDGSQFDSSRDKNKPFNFRLGKGEVIKGWDKGVATMRRGEKAIFTIRSDYGYGAEGSGSSIPGDATLIFEVELLAWNEIDITNDGGVLIKVIDGHKGTGWRHPENNAEVHIKWEGRVNGTAFAASANNDFEFVQLGSPSCPLPSGVQRAISQEMKKDSRAQITAKPEYAFGAEGLPGQVPPHATVEYVVELKDWNTVHDVASDGGITVKLLGQIEAYGAKAEDASKVTMTIEGKVLPDGPVFMGPTEKVVIVGDGKMPEGVERGLEKIKKGHPAIITCHSRYAYGEHGNPDLGVPPNADVQFSVNVTDVRATYELNVQEKLAAADKRKLQGNDFFKAGDFERALGKYAKAFKLVEYEREDEDNENATHLREVKTTLHLNKAAVYDKQGATKVAEVIDECKQALKISPHNIKALFRRGKALASAGRLDEALVDLKMALEKEPGNAAVKSQIALCKQMQKAQNEKDKKLFGAMFRSPGAICLNGEGLKKKDPMEVDAAKEEGDLDETALLSQPISATQDQDMMEVEKPQENPAPVAQV